HKEVWENAPHLNWATLAGVGGTLVFLMGTRQLRNNMQRLINHGLPAETPVALIRWGTDPTRKFSPERWRPLLVWRQSGISNRLPSRWSVKLYACASAC